MHKHIFCKKGTHMNTNTHAYLDRQTPGSRKQEQLKMYFNQSNKYLQVKVHSI